MAERNGGYFRAAFGARSPFLFPEIILSEYRGTLHHCSRRALRFRRFGRACDGPKETTCNECGAHRRRLVGRTSQLGRALVSYILQSSYELSGGARSWRWAERRFSRGGGTIVGRSITAHGAPCVFVDSEERARDPRKQRSMNAERIEGDWSVGHRCSAARWFPVF